MEHRWKGRAMRLGSAALLAAALTGCAIAPPLVRSEVTTFNEWATLPADRTYTFARTLEYRDSLEVKSYEDIVRDELAVQGFKLAIEPSQANLVVTLRPSVTWTRVRIRDQWPIDPFWSPYGFYGRRSFGWYDPFWSSGFGNYGNYGNYGSADVEVFRRRLELDIDSRTVVGKRYYEGRVENTGDTESMTGVMPILVRALFTDFPGNNGQTRRVDLPAPPKP